MFHGQFAMNGLLEATDAKVKEELSLVVPLNIWQEGVSIARANSDEASKKSSEFVGYGSSSIKWFWWSCETARRCRGKEVYSTGGIWAYGSLNQIRNPPASWIDSWCAWYQYWFSAIHTWWDHVNDSGTRVSAQKRRGWAGLGPSRINVAVTELESANTNREQIAKKWNMDLFSDAMVDSILPELCPTCQQPISSTGSGHSHAKMQRIVKEEIDGVVLNLVAAEDSVL